MSNVWTGPKCQVLSEVRNLIAGAVLRSTPPLNLYRFNATEYHTS